MPLLLWFGGDTDLAPAAVGEALAARIPGSSFHLFTDETHFGTVLKHRGEILTTLCCL
jgi:pimeloyl-ACP methyl ester carboxylesterase